MGYHRAGFDVVGVDIEPQPRYPFEFHRADALDFPLEGFDVVHASPPCQRFSAVTPKARRKAHPDLIAPIRDRLRAWGGLYVIENVKRSVLVEPVLICGGAMGRPIKRHRWFESNRVLLVPGCMCGVQRPRFRTFHSVRGWYLASVVHLAGSTGGKGGVALRREAMGIPWATGAELAQAIPPDYTELVGAQLCLGGKVRGSSDVGY